MNVDALREAIEYLVDRHPCLRTTFSDAGAELRQEVHEQLRPEFLVIDARDFSEAQMRRRVIEETQRPFDLEQGPLLRLAVLQHRDDDFVIVATTHHIVVDFWSLILMLSELREAYPSFVEGQTPDLPALRRQLCRVCQRQQQMLASAEGERLWEFWRQTLDGAPTVLDWATDYKRPANFTGRADVTPLEFARYRRKDCPRRPTSQDDNHRCRAGRFASVHLSQYQSAIVLDRQSICRTRSQHV